MGLIRKVEMKQNLEGIKDYEKIRGNLPRWVKQLGIVKEWGCMLGELER